jgi:predicted nucleotidyltransferase component of viral defense system
VPFSDIYQRQVALLIRILPFVAEQKVFALKGGTAINLFVRDMPRLSVDIDLTYLPVQPRPQSLTAIDQAMKTIAARVADTFAGAEISTSVVEGAITTLYVKIDKAQIKIEVTPVLRGCVFDPAERRVSEAVEAKFGFAEMLVVSFADLYAGKIIAALDRQHPRDLFDIRDLLANEGIDDALRTAVIVYLLSHNRPMHEVLAPVRKPLDQEFVRGFQGMTESAITVEELASARETLIAEIVGKMPDVHRHFLISFERGFPEWELLSLPHIADLPAVKWRMLNLNKLSNEARDDLVGKLEKVLNRI